jgi:hypothetical protein
MKRKIGMTAFAALMCIGLLASQPASASVLGDIINTVNDILLDPVLAGLSDLIGGGGG